MRVLGCSHFVRIDGKLYACPSGAHYVPGNLKLPVTPPLAREWLSQHAKAR